MNFVVHASGILAEPFGQVLKLFIQSARESDYKVVIRGKPLYSPVSPMLVSISLVGSKRHDARNIYADFDNVLLEETSDPVLSPKTLEIERNADGLHYWAVLGGMMKVLSDISPAFVTGYLLESRQDAKLKMFKEFSNRLPMGMQLELMETMRESD